VRFHAGLALLSVAGNVVWPEAQRLAALEDNWRAMDAGLVSSNVPLARGEADVAAFNVTLVEFLRRDSAPDPHTLAGTVFSRGPRSSRWVMFDEPSFLDVNTADRERVRRHCRACGQVWNR